MGHDTIATLPHTADFMVNPATTAIFTYSPTNTAQDNTIQHYHEILQRTVESVPFPTVLIVLGHITRKEGTIMS